MERPPSAELPDRPGAYLFRDQHGQVLYAGKAKSLRKRVLSYFNRDVALRTRTMIETAESVETIVQALEGLGPWLQSASPVEYRHFLEGAAEKLGSERAALSNVFDVTPDDASGAAPESATSGALGNPED